MQFMAKNIFVSNQWLYIFAINKLFFSGNCLSVIYFGHCILASVHNLRGEDICNNLFQSQLLNCLAREKSLLENKIGQNKKKKVKNCGCNTIVNYLKCSLNTQIFNVKI